MTDPSLSDLIEAHRSEVHLSDTQRGRARGRLLAQVGAGAAVTSVAASASGAVSGWLAKLTLGLAVIGSAGGAYYASRPAAPAVQSAPAPATKASGAKNVTPTAPEAPAPAPDVAAAARDEPPPAPASRPAPSVKAPAAKRPLADEVKTMQAVDAALRSGDADGALALLNRDGAADGALQEERAAAHVFALCQLGRKVEARSQVARFAQRFPRSPLLGRVKSSCP